MEFVLIIIVYCPQMSSLCHVPRCLYPSALLSVPLGHVKPLRRVFQYAVLTACPVQRGKSAIVQVINILYTIFYSDTNLLSH